MRVFSRRQFLKQAGASAAALLLARRRFFAPPVVLSASEADVFEMLVVGDSLVSGQGLKEENKFYTLVKDWLERDVFGAARRVSLTVKAHSGARLNLPPNEIEALKRAERDEATGYNAELNLSFPSLAAQLAAARRDYKDPQAVDLIMLSGSITDITVAEILDPFGDNKKLRADITKYCRREMHLRLADAARIFPNAQIAVIGYYPMISPKSDAGKIFNSTLELYKFPRPLKPLANNPFTKQFFKILHRRAVKRSRIWTEGSNRELQAAVDRLNAGLDAPRAIFVRSPITEENCFGTRNSLVWEMGKKGRSTDENFAARVAACNREMTAINNSTGLKTSVRFCQLAALGHPNVEGAKAYAEAVKNSLTPRIYRSR